MKSTPFPGAVRHSFPAGVLMLAALALPGATWAQTATVQGSLSAFDVVNDTGQAVHGFEIRIEGAMPGDLYYTAFGQRYGNPKVVPYSTGVAIRYESPYDPASGTFTQTTPQHTPGTPFSWNDCYQAGSTYATSGCEHFGQSLRPTPSGQAITVSGRWLIADPNNAGSLLPLDPPAAIPFATWSVIASTVIGTAPVVLAEIEAPEPPETPEKYGDAQWTKIYTAQFTRELTGDELVSTNTGVVPQDPSKLEVAWDILQASPPTNSKGNQNRTQKRNQGSIAADTQAVVRRYELYKFTGTYDATTHQAICADGTCTAPSPGELGDAVSAQNTAVNLAADSLIITTSGTGSVTGANGKISCGKARSTFAPNSTVLTLTAVPSGTVFTGWSGACTGNQLTCSVALNGEMTVLATFKSQFTLSVGRSNPGTITGSPAGNDRVIDCGGNCSAKFTDGTVVTLTAVPPAGKQFVNWAGACSGTSPTCTLTIKQNSSVQAVFSK